MSSDSNATMEVAETRSLTPKFPAMDDLPKVSGQPQGCMWGFYDKEGTKKDEVGSINLLTHDVVKAAAREIRTGEHIQLDWGLNVGVQFPGGGRKEFEQTIINGESYGVCAFDDVLHINTQSSSQWDSLKHWAHQESKMFYNGLSYEEAKNSITNGIHNLCERGGIAGRGVLLDWVRWYEHKHGKASPSPVTRHEITVQDLEEVIKYQGTILQPADILIIRSGFVRWHNMASREERVQGTQGNYNSIGLPGNEETVRWLYDHHLAAVAGDMTAFEAWPADFGSGYVLHEWLLTQWGTPIGELWDLEKLSQTCEKENRWTFFLTSAPLHVKGGIGSPAGAIAFF